MYILMGFTVVFSCAQMAHVIVFTHPSGRANLTGQIKALKHPFLSGCSRRLGPHGWRLSQQTGVGKLCIAPDPFFHSAFSSALCFLSASTSFPLPGPSFCLGPSQPWTEKRGPWAGPESSREECTEDLDLVTVLTCKWSIFADVFKCVRWMERMQWWFFW